MENGLLTFDDRSLDFDFFKKLSYKSELGISLKRTLRHFDKDSLLTDVLNISFTTDVAIIPDWIEYRLKSKESISRKYSRYVGQSREVEKVFNDTLGLRYVCNEYENISCLDSRYLEVADMQGGKACDDGYRGVHIYFQLDHRHYPIEIQFNTKRDRIFADWCHEYLYKLSSYKDEIGAELRKRYDKGQILSLKDFLEVRKCLI